MGSFTSWLARQVTTLSRYGCARDAPPVARHRDSDVLRDLTTQVRRFGPRYVRDLDADLVRDLRQDLRYDRRSANIVLRPPYDRPSRVRVWSCARRRQCLDAPRRPRVYGARLRALTAPPPSSRTWHLRDGPTDRFQFAFDVVFARAYPTSISPVSHDTPSASHQCIRSPPQVFALRARSSAPFALDRLLDAQPNGLTFDQQIGRAQRRAVSRTSVS